MPTENWGIQNSYHKYAKSDSNILKMEAQMIKKCAPIKNYLLSFNRITHSEGDQFRLQSGKTQIDYLEQFTYKLIIL